MGSGERLERLPHAHPEALAPYSGLLDQLRSLPALTEQRSAGTFHRGSRTFLHFHAHPDGLVADLKAGSGWERIAVTHDEGVELVRRVHWVID